MHTLCIYVDLLALIDYCIVISLFLNHVSSCDITPLLLWGGSPLCLRYLYGSTHNYFSTNEYVRSPLDDHVNGGLVELRLKPVCRRYFRTGPHAARPFNNLLDVLLFFAQIHHKKTYSSSRNRHKKLRARTFSITARFLVLKFPGEFSKT